MILAKPLNNRHPFTPIRQIKVFRLTDEYITVQFLMTINENDFLWLKFDVLNIFCFSENNDDREKMSCMDNPWNHPS